MIAWRHLLLPLCALLGCAMVIYGGSLPDYWLRRSMPEGMEPAYPVQWVLLFCVIVLAECSLLLAVLRPWSYCRSWGRAWCATLLAIPLALFWLTGVLHSPPHYGLHLQWWLLVCAALLVLSLYSSIAAWLHQRAERVAG
ncbi:hypothetical protein [Aquipseudomonas alcaligenes]|jgi:hypothetical protein|uniref:hypothetical protein n=1 Tax=Aquipseudomonas alcaligenes TaxID=43263 RepID=UPI001F182E2C|nr:hypothetical protein [Pseudomonas alcaligenes]